MTSDCSASETRTALTLLARMLDPRRPDHVRAAAAVALGRSTVIRALPRDLCGAIRRPVVSAGEHMASELERPSLRLVPGRPGPDDQP